MADLPPKKDNSTSDNKSAQQTPHPVFDWRPVLFTLITFLLYYTLFQPSHEKPETLSYSEFKSLAAAERIQSVTIQGLEAQGITSATDTDGKSTRFITTLPEFSDPSLLPLLEKHNIKVEIKSSEPPVWLSLIISILPWLLIFGFFAYSNHALQSRMGGGRRGGGGRKEGEELCALRGHKGGRK